MHIEPGVVDGAKIVLSRSQADAYQETYIGGTRSFGMDPPEFKWDTMLDDSRLKVGAIELELVPAPGHSPESVCFYHRAYKALICGDVVFEMNTGRVDFPGGSGETLKESIEGLARLDIEYLLPGHMGVVAGAKIVKANFDFIRSNVFPWL